MDGKPQDSMRDCIELQKLMEPGYSDELSVCVQYSNFKTLDGTLLPQKGYSHIHLNMIFGQYFKSDLRISYVHPLCQ